MTITPEIGEIPVFSPEKPDPSEFHDGILVRSPNWLGDAVMAIPALLQLKTILPDYCGLFVAAPQGIAALYDDLPFIDRVIPLADAHAFPRLPEIRSIRRLQAGIGVLLNNSFRDALSFRFCGIRRLYGASARHRSFLMKRSFEFPPRLDHTLNKPHQAAKYLAIARALGAQPWNGIMPEFREHATENTLPQKALNAMKAPGKRLAVAAGAAYGGAKRWNPEGFRAVCEAWIRDGGSIVMTGSPAEHDGAAEIIRGLPNAFNLAGLTSVDELIYLLKRSDACIANDSGVMHLAAACGIPGVTPFGPTDPAATSPLSKRWRIVFGKIGCSPCFRRECPHPPRRCFDGITPEILLNALKEAMTAK